MSERITLNAFIEKHRLWARVESIPERADGTKSGPEGMHWRFTIQKGVSLSLAARPSLTVEYSEDPGAWERREVEMGMDDGFLDEPFAPPMSSILNCLADEASLYENTCNIDDWAGELGYDSRSPGILEIVRQYEQVKDQAQKLRDLLGEAAYQELLWNTERE